MSIESVADTTGRIPDLRFCDTESPAEDATTIGVLAAVRAAIPQAADVGIRRERQPHSALPPARRAADVLDRLQTELGDGPSVAVLRQRRTVAVDVQTDRRWPAFNARARQLGIGAVLSVPLIVAHCELGALSLYARTGSEFTVDDETIATLFATTMAWALLAEHHHRLAATAGYEVVDPATGVIAASGTVMSRDAFTVFVATAQHDDRGSVDTADKLVGRFAPAAWTEADEWGTSRTARMAVRVRCATRPTVVELAGDIDFATAPYLQALHGLPPGDVTVDLSQVTFLACAGLTELLALRTHLHTGGAALHLAGASSSIRRLITATELHGLLPC